MNRIRFGGSVAFATLSAHEALPGGDVRLFPDRSTLPGTHRTGTIASVSTWVEIGDRVFVRRYAVYDQNIGVVLGEGAALVIDTRSTHAQGREILADLRELTANPVTVVVDTHGHYDHAFGNHVFRPAESWGHVDCARLMTAELARAALVNVAPKLMDDLAEVVIDPPNRTFQTAVTIEVGGRSLDLRYLGRGHTDNDIVVSVPGADVIFAGDLVEGGAVPSFDDAYPLDWPATASALADLVTGTIVPGHGNHAGRAFATEQAAAIAVIAELAHRVHRSEITLDDARSLTPFPAFPPEDVRAPLERALAQLRGELTGPGVRKAQDEPGGRA